MRLCLQVQKPCHLIRKLKIFSFFFSRVHASVSSRPSITYTLCSTLKENNNIHIYTFFRRVYYYYYYYGDGHAPNLVLSSCAGRWFETSALYTILLIITVSRWYFFFLSYKLHLVTTARRWCLRAGGRTRRSRDVLRSGRKYNYRIYEKASAEGSRRARQPLDNALIFFSSSSEYESPYFSLHTLYTAYEI